MTPKEKAESLLNKFIVEGCLFANAKKCALICVEEMQDLNTFKSTPEQCLVHVKYWQEVKKEIEKL